jgi:hypothetical protein
LCAIRAADAVAAREFVAKTGDAEVAAPVQIAAHNRSKAVDFRLIGIKSTQFRVFSHGLLVPHGASSTQPTAICLALDAHFEARGFDQRQPESGVHQNKRNAPSPFVE